jgi:hypothetical protein
MFLVKRYLSDTDITCYGSRIFHRRDRRSLPLDPILNQFILLQTFICADVFQVVSFLDILQPTFLCISCISYDDILPVSYVLI